MLAARKSRQWRTSFWFRDKCHSRQA